MAAIQLAHGPPPPPSSLATVPLACRRISAGSRSSLRFAAIFLLPDEIMLCIFADLDVRSLARASATCRHWLKLVSESGLWETLYTERWPFASVPVSVSVHGSPMLALTQIYGRASSSAAKRAYFYKDRLERNWFRGKHDDMRVFQGHSAPISCARLRGDLLVSSSLDCTVKLWFASTGLCVQTIRVHSRAVWAHESDSVRLISAGDDRELLVSDLASGRPYLTLQGHQGWIHAVTLADEAGSVVLTGSGDHTARLWDLRSGTPVRTYTDHRAPVETLLRHGTWLATGGCDRMVHLYDLRSTGAPLACYPVEGVVTELALHRDTLLAAQSYPAAVSAWDVSTGCAVPALSEFPREQTLTSLVADADRLVLGGSDCVVRVYDPSGALRASLPLLYRTRREHIVPHNRNAIRCLAMDERRLVIGSTDWLLRLYNFDV